MEKRSRKAKPLHAGVEKAADATPAEASEVRAGL